MEDRDELTIKSVAIKAVAEAIEPYLDDLKEEKREAAREREREARYAEEDRKRLEERFERQAEEVAERVVVKVMKRFELDPDKPADFIKLIEFLRDFQTTIRDARKHGLIVIIGLIAGGAATLLWTAFKGSLHQ